MLFNKNYLISEALYKETYICFIKGFVYHKKKTELISCVKDFYKFEVQLMYSMNMVVEGLQDIGLSLSESIENMVKTLGLQLPQFGEYFSVFFVRSFVDWKLNTYSSILSRKIANSNIF